MDLLKDKYEEVRGKLDCFQLLAEELSAGFTANQVGSLVSFLVWRLLCWGAVRV